MSDVLRRVDPPASPGLATRAMSRFSTTNGGRWVARRLGWKLDPVLLRVTGGRVSSTLVVPTALLETRGAKTGRARRNAVIYFHDGDRVIVIPSHAGDPRHPAWYHNLRAHPDVVLGGVPMRAAVVTDEAERERLWGLADRVLPAYADFRRSAAAAGRTIPVVSLVE